MRLLLNLQISQMIYLKMDPSNLKTNKIITLCKSGKDASEICDIRPTSFLLSNLSKTIIFLKLKCYFDNYKVVSEISAERYSTTPHQIVMYLLIHSTSFRYAHFG